MPRTTCLVPTGTANLASVEAALRRAGTEPVRTLDPSRIEAAETVVLPGVGAFAAAMTQLTESGADDALRRRIERGAPTLAICLGMQLFAAQSAESPGIRGLGVIETECTRLDAPRIPQLGWNTVRSAEEDSDDGADDRERIVRTDWMAFAHSYAFTDPGALRAAGWRVSTACAGATYVAACERGAVVACQFHPELSGRAGRDLLQRWLSAAARIERSEVTS